MTSDNSTPSDDLPEDLPEDLAVSDSFKISPLIQLTLTALYIALVIPLPFLATATHASVSPQLLWVLIPLGGIALWSGLSERVVVNDEGIAVTYPGWVRALGRKGWSLRWAEITAIKPRSTGQGGIVYYFLNQAQDQAYLLPMRVVGFARLVRYVEAKTDLDTRDVRPLSQPWMYVILLGLTALLLLVDIWAIAQAQTGLVAQAQTGLVAQAQTGLVAQAQTGLVAQAQTGLVAQAQTGLVAQAQTAINLMNGALDCVDLNV